MSLTEKLLFIRGSGEQAVKEEPQPLALQRNSHLSQFQLQINQAIPLCLLAITLCTDTAPSNRQTLLEACYPLTFQLLPL